MEMRTLIRNDFNKAMGAVLLTAEAALADAERVMDYADARRKAEQTQSLAREFCRLLIVPVEEYGADFAQIIGFAETYCRTHISVATDYLRHAMATHDPASPECKRMAHIAGLIERNLKQYLDEKTAIRCWFGDRVSEVEEFKKYGNLD
jgi:hypothetical protein